MSKISFTTVPANLNLKNGYGNAGYNVSLSLQKLGVEVPFQDPTAPYEIAFNQPNYPEVWSGDRSTQHRIMYTPWESTALPDGWLEGFKEADEIWTPSDLIAEWFKDAGVPGHIKVYEHGIDPAWFSAERTRRRGNGPLMFLHHGEPAPRKGGQMALDAFRAAFGKNNNDVHLTIKSFGHTNVRAQVIDEYGDPFVLGAPEDFYKNVAILRQDYEIPALVRLYKAHDVLVYPGWGEGFGLIPLQAMAAGMPTICTSAWAPYRDFIVKDLRLPSTLVDSPWPRIHPGKMFKPSFDDLVDIYRFTFDNYDEIAREQEAMMPALREKYDWSRLTAEAFDFLL